MSGRIRGGALSGDGCRGLELLLFWNPIRNRRCIAVVRHLRSHAFNNDRNRWRKGNSRYRCRECLLRCVAPGRRLMSGRTLAELLVLGAAPAVAMSVPTTQQLMSRPAHWLRRATSVCTAVAAGIAGPAFAGPVSAGAMPRCRPLTIAADDATPCCPLLTQLQPELPADFPADL